MTVLPPFELLEGEISNASACSSRQRSLMTAVYAVWDDRGVSDTVPEWQRRHHYMHQSNHIIEVWLASAGLSDAQ